MSEAVKKEVELIERFLKENYPKEDEDILDYLNIKMSKGFQLRLIKWVRRETLKEVKRRR